MANLFVYCTALFPNAEKVIMPGLKERFHFPAWPVWVITVHSWPGMRTQTCFCLLARGFQLIQQKQAWKSHLLTRYTHVQA